MRNMHAFGDITTANRMASAGRRAARRGVRHAVSAAAFALFAALCGASAQGARAAATDDEELALAMVYGDKSTISLATGSPQPLRRAPAVATVITAEDIAAMGAADLDEVLATVPGLHIARSNQANSPLYVVRGIFSELNPQTLMLQNGVPMTTLFVGSRGLVWGGLPVQQIARIEIIRGPGSALYGADAFAGVINIVTKSAADLSGTELGVRLGSFRSRDAWIQHGGRWGPAAIATFLRIGRSDGDKRTVEADAQTQLDQLFGTHASLAPGPVHNGYRRALDGGLDLAWDTLRLRVGLKQRDGLGSGAGVGSALDPYGLINSRRLHADLTWNDILAGAGWHLGATLSGFHYQQTYDRPLQVFPPGAFGGAFPDGMFGAPQTWERQWRFSVLATYGGWDGHQWRIGAGYDDLDMYRTRELKNFSFITSGPLAGLPTPTPGGQVIEFPVDQSFLAPHARRVKHVYVQDEWSLARDWTLTAGVRRDLYSDFGGTTNPRLALVWDATLDLTAKLLYGRAFRAPAFTELYSINNPVIQGNRGLRPETIRTLEAAFAWQVRKDLQANLSLYRYGMSDIIRTTPVTDGLARFVNLGGQHGSGVELETRWDASRRLRLSAHWSMQRSVDDTTGRDVGYAPRHRVHAQLDWQFDSGWQAGLQALRVVDRRRAAGDARPPIADYTTADLTLRSPRMRGGWELTATLRNAFDADVREPSLAPGAALPNDLPMPGRTWSLQAQYQF
jgi:iron complex outermembrane receptor protein